VAAALGTDVSVAALGPNDDAAAPAATPGDEEP
jgi:hypothetical protein